MPGTLYVIATPIGNLEDITPRAARVLGEVDLIAAEDTRHSRVLLTHLMKNRSPVKIPIFSCHKFNEGKRGDFFVGALLEGRNIALISDAGTPCISDPGFRLVRAAAEAGITVVPICGASAVTAALSVCGFEAARFAFIGFLPRKKEATTALAGAFSGNEVVVFYESPRRIIGTLEMLRENFAQARICLCNDISKKFERIYRGTAEEILAELSANPSAEKGEYTCVVKFDVLGGSAPAKETSHFDSDNRPVSPVSIEARLVDIMAQSGCATLKDASRELHKSDPTLSKKEIYAAMLRVKELFDYGGKYHYT